MKNRPAMTQAALSMAAAIVVALVVAAGGQSLGSAAEPAAESIGQRKGPHPPTRVSELITQAPSTGQGRQLYMRDCAWCHGSRGEGTGVAPPLIGTGALATDFYLSTGRMPEATPVDDPPRRTPAYGRQEIDQLVAFVASFGPGPAVPRVTPQAGRLSEGAVLYESNCAACHSSAGIGGALTQGKVAPSILTSTSTHVAEAVRLGGTGNMPVFGPETLSEEQVSSILRYVQYLQRPRDRGGLPLGRIGPIAEGFVAWVVGLLLLVVFVRWTGMRASE
jgi:ubiquinol-cytochrome c reductase cytochrome c subunit